MIRDEEHHDQRYEDETDPYLTGTIEDYDGDWLSELDEWVPRRREPGLYEVSRLDRRGQADRTELIRAESAEAAIGLWREQHANQHATVLATTI